MLLHFVLNVEMNLFTSFRQYRSLEKEKAEIEHPQNMKYQNSMNKVKQNDLN